MSHAQAHAQAALQSLPPGVRAPFSGDPHTDEMVAGWLHEKFGRSRSTRTRDAYSAVIARFRSYLYWSVQGLDLNAAGWDPTFERLIADAAQTWCALAYGADSPPDQPVANATHNQRLAILSSFYEWCRRRRYLPTNPMEMVARRPGDDGRSPRRAHALTTQQAAAALARIPTDTLAGLRDRALLAVAFTTSRRRAELCALRLGHLTNLADLRVDGQQHRLHVVWPRTKGGKALEDDLDGVVSQLLGRYLATLYGLWQHGAPLWVPPATLQAAQALDWPVWVSLAYRHRGRFVPLGPQGVADVCQRWLGTRKVHTTRHSFALAMEQAGAPYTLIRDRMGHSSLAITSRYMERLHDAENPYAARVAEALGLTPAQGEEPDQP